MSQKPLPSSLNIEHARAANTPAKCDWAAAKTLRLVTLTPITGGGSKKQELGPDSEPIRASAIRGQMRGWWRARYGRRYAKSQEL